ncbi:MAG: hypothetical protein ACTSRZ_16480 [Promethearchaeota archaeon]
MQIINKCASCGINLNDIDINNYEQNKQNLLKLDTKIQQQNLILCSECTSNYNKLPKFNLVISAFAHEYFMEKGIKDPKNALKKLLILFLCYPIGKYIKRQYLTLIQ